MNSNRFPSLADLGRPDSIMDTLDKVNGPGLVVVSGQSSGVSTTLASVGAEFQRQDYKVLSLRFGHDETLPGIQNLDGPTEKFFIRSVLGVYQPDVIIIDTPSYTPEMMRVAVGFAKMDGLVIAGIHASAPEEAVERILLDCKDVNSHEIADVLIMSVHQKMVPYEEGEFSTDHWAAVGRAENLMSMANPRRYPFAYREDLKVEVTVNVYVPTERWSAPRMDSYLSSKRWKSDAEFLEVLKSHRVVAA